MTVGDDVPCSHDIHGPLADSIVDTVCECGSVADSEGPEKLTDA